MPIPATCASCGKQYNLADHLQGKKVKCNCGAIMTVPAVKPEVLQPEILEPEIVEPEILTPEIVSDAPRLSPAAARQSVQANEPAPPAGRARRTRDDDDRPRRRRDLDRDDDEDDDDRPRRRRRQASGGNALPWILAGTGVAVVAVVVVVVLLLKSSPVQAPIDFPQVANNPMAKADVGKVAAPNFDLPKIEFPKIEIPKIKPLGPGNPVKKVPIDPNALKPVAPPAVKWAAQPDPGPDMMKPPANPQGVFVTAGNPHVVVPATPSHFMAIRAGVGTKQTWQVIDLRTLAPTALIAGKLDISNEALSPDGKFMVGKGKFQANPTTIHVVSLDKGQIIQSVQLDTKFSNFGLLDFLDNGHIIAQESKGLTSQYRVINIATGQQVKEFTIDGLLIDRKNTIALSPGRKYVAIAHKHKIDIYQGTTGQWVGELNVPVDNPNFRGLTFSPDGQELACHIERLGSGSHLICWKMTTGEQSVHHKFAKDVRLLADNSFLYQGPHIEWVPDRSGWIFYGQIWVDYQSGSAAYKIAGSPNLKGARRLIGVEHLVEVTSDFKSGQLGFRTLPKADIAAAVQKAREGAAAPVAALPAARPVNVAAARALPAPNGPVAWKAVPDPAPLPKVVLAMRPITLKAKADEIQQIVFSRPNATRTKVVVVARTTPNPLSPRKQFRADVHDAGGPPEGACELFGTDDPNDNTTVKADVSPDGDRLALRRSKDEKRVDVWDLAANKHLAGFEPFGGTPVEWFGFVDGDRLLTLGANAKLALWKLPECQPVWVVDGYRGALQFSGNRKYLVAMAGAGLELIESATGDRAGQLAMPGAPVSLLQSAAFSLDGTELVATVSLPGTVKIGRWKLADGSFQGAMNTVYGQQPMLWVSPNFVLHGNTLYDWNLKNGLYTYTLPGPGQFAAGSPDGRAWFAYGFGPDNATTVLTAQTLPDGVAQQLSTTIAGGGAQQAVTPGSNVQLAIASNSDKFRGEVQQTLEKNAQNQGYKLGNGGIRVTIDAQEAPTGKMLPFEITRIGIGKGPPIVNVNIPERLITCQATFTDAQGTVLLKVDSKYRTPSRFTFRANDDNYDRQLTDAMWERAINWGRFLPLPTNMYRIGGQLQALPRTGPILGGG